MVLFGGAVFLLGMMIRGCNKQFGWYEANSIDLQVDAPLDQSKFRWYVVDDFKRNDQGAIPMPITYGQMVYDSVLVKPFPQIEDENNFVLVYDSVWVFPFIHYKMRHETQHSYEFHIWMDDSVPRLDAVIDGPSYTSLSGAFTSISDSVAYLPFEGPNYDGEIEELEDVIKAEEPKVEVKESGEGETETDPNTTTDHDPR